MVFYFTAAGAGTSPFAAGRSQYNAFAGSRSRNIAFSREPEPETGQRPAAALPVPNPDSGGTRPSRQARHQKRWQATVSPAMTMETIDISLIRMLSDGPEVSLNGSPTVSPTTVAL